MTWLSRCLCAVVVLVLLVAVAVTRPAWSRAVGLDLGGLSEDLWKLQDEGERRQRLDAERIITLRRIAGKDRLALDLAAGRVTLLEAARCLRELLHSAPPTLQRGIAWERGRSEEERLCRHLIRRVETLLASKPEEARRITRRLEADLAAPPPSEPVQFQRLRAE